MSKFKTKMLLNEDILSKTKGTTRDTRGMKFEYFIYDVKHIGYDLDKDEIKKTTLEKLYVSKDFPNIKATTLKELQILMGKIG